MRLYISRSGLPAIKEQLKDTCRLKIAVHSVSPARNAIYTSEGATCIGKRVHVKLVKARIVYHDAYVKGIRGLLNLVTLPDTVELRITNTDRRTILAM